MPNEIHFSIPFVSLMKERHRRTTSIPSTKLHCKNVESTRIIEWEGYLRKQCGIMRSWRRRYVVLRGCTVEFFASKEKAMMDRSSHGEEIIISCCGRDRIHEGGLILTSVTGKVYRLLAETEIEGIVWIAVVNETLEGQQVPRFSIQLPAVHSFENLVQRNTEFITNFYHLWSKLMVVNMRKDAVSKLLALFQSCTEDVVLSVKLPQRIPFGGEFHGREGVFQFLLLHYRVISVREYSVIQIIHENDANVMKVRGHSYLKVRKSGKIYFAYWKHTVSMSPGGRVRHLTIAFDIEGSTFDIPATPSPVKPYTRTKRVLSLTIKDFDVLSVLGRGAFGTVIKARYKRGGQLMAIKILSKDSMSNYDRIRTSIEMRVLRDVHHPFIANLRFSFQSSSKLYLGMEYYSGGSLYSHLKKKRDQEVFFNEENIQIFAAEIVLALGHLHALEIVYRDLKPENIMIDRDGHVVLVDFGLSKLNVKSLEGAHTMAGSPAYTAPELLVPRDSRSYGTSVDWWCLGIVLYEVLTGCRPFDDANIAVMYEKIEKDIVRFPFDREIGFNARLLIKGLLQKDPTRRLGSVNGAADIMQHPFFRDVDWASVLSKEGLTPFETAADVENNRQFTVRDAQCVAHSSSGHYVPPDPSDIFYGFSFINDSETSFLVDEEEILGSLHTLKM